MLSSFGRGFNVCFQSLEKSDGNLGLVVCVIEKHSVDVS